MYVDGKFAVGLNVNDVIKLGLANSQEISQQELNKIIESSNFGKAFNSAINFLSYRPRSEYEVRQYLEIKIRKKKEDRRKLDEGDKDIIENVVTKLRDIGQINDEEFAKWWVEQRSAFRPKGKRALEIELRRKGVKAKVEVGNEVELAVKAIQKKLPMPKEKIFRYLISRGFSYDTVDSVIEKVGAKE